MQMEVLDRNSLLRDLDVLEALHRLPPEAALTTNEAAIFLRISPRTLERMRKEGNGPMYLQPGKVNAAGTNQKITYRKSDLLSYQESIKVTSSLSAAVRKGQAFIPYANSTPRRVDHDLITKRPFYIDGSGLILQSVEDTTIKQVIEFLGDVEIEWLSPMKAIISDWIYRESKEEFSRTIRDALCNAVQIIDKVLQDSNGKANRGCC